MTDRIGNFTIALAGTVLAALVLLTQPAPVFAQSLEQQIEQSLKSKAPPAPPPGMLTRGLTVGGPAPAADPAAAANRQFIQGLRTRSIAVEGTQPVSADERAKIADIVQSKPKIDLEIFFDYDSAVVTQRAMPSLIALGNVISKPDFTGTVFLINGYTDAKGSPDYNQSLSKRRADSVRKLLIETYKLPPDTLIAVGFGKEQLKNPGNPFADENRRVQIVNTEVKAAAK